MKNKHTKLLHTKLTKKGTLDKGMREFYELSRQLDNIIKQF